MSTKWKIISITIATLLFLAIAILSVRGRYQWIIWPEGISDSRTENGDINNSSINNREKIHITPDKQNIIEIRSVDYDATRGCYIVDLNPIKTGEVTLRVDSPGMSFKNSITDFKVLPFGIIMVKGDIGSISNVDIIRVEILVLFILIGINIGFALYKLVKEDRYSYTIMYYIGALVYIIVNIFMFSLLIIVDNPVDDKLAYLVSDFVNDGIYFVYLLFPIIIILAVFLVISNLVLIIREGGGVRNLLGIALAMFLVITTLGIDWISSIFAEQSYIVLFFATIFYGLLTYFECIMMGTLIATTISHHHIPRKEMDYIIILGCGLREDGTPIPLLQGRIDRALWLYNRQLKKKGTEMMFVCSGGQGPDEIISEALSIKNYLLSKGIREELILIEDKSTSTYENMKYSREVIEAYKEKNGINKMQNIAFSTTDYHVFRSGYLAGRLGINAEGIGSRTRWYFYPNALIREFVANISNQRIKHIVNSLIISAVCVMICIVSIVA